MHSNHTCLSRTARLISNKSSNALLIVQNKVKLYWSKKSLNMHTSRTNIHLESTGRMSLTSLVRVSEMSATLAVKCPAIFILLVAD